MASRVGALGARPNRRYLRPWMASRVGALGARPKAHVDRGACFSGQGRVIGDETCVGWRRVSIGSFTADRSNNPT